MQALPRDGRPGDGDAAAKGGVRMIGMPDTAMLPAAHNAATVAPLAMPPPSRRGCAPDIVDHIDLNWSDFMFNVISMSIVYAYFSRASAQNESITAVLLCMSVAAFDIVLLLMRWLWCASLASDLANFSKRLHGILCYSQCASAQGCARVRERKADVMVLYEHGERMLLVQV